MSNDMRYRTNHLIVCASLLTCYSMPSFGGNNWITFSSDSINPKPVVWLTEDWVNYSISETTPFRRYSFKYPSGWAFTGYSVFEDTKKRKVAEFTPGVIALAEDQHCFESAGQRAHRYQTFRLGAVKGRVIVADTVFDDSPESFRVYSYCIEQDSYAFTFTFIERKSGPSLAATFRKIMRSFQFTSNDA